MNHQITEAYTREFAVAPRASRGDVVHFEKVDPKNHHWFFGRDVRGVVGFFPVDWFQIDGQSAVASRDYDAAELSVSVGRPVTIIERYGGWLFVADGGSRGWIPEQAVKK